MSLNEVAIAPAIIFKDVAIDRLVLERVGSNHKQESKSGGQSRKLYSVLFERMEYPPPFPKNDFGLSQATGGGWFLVRITPFSPI